ncbi:MFS transporter [Pelagicoccus enzymogenes]|uniref:MFS transporter n=1 Tax=Pelagicoccus enzymogenes TaxID=2773457 RepID=UPI00280FCE6E|nr:MFS transporter [Pelagicoccus enzymogenes]MDQ8197253.1 MFS transporter [Pelagicoccus enzymogenes]
MTTATKGVSKSELLNSGSKDGERLSVSEKLSYGLGDTASNFFFQTFNLFLLYYYTDVFGIGPAAAGSIFLAARVVDMFSDPIMGVISDRTNSRWGKFRPYLLWMAIPYGMIGYLMFVVPDISEGGKLAYAYATYIAMMLAYTAINIPYSALLGVISPSSTERTLVSSYRFFGAFAGGLLISMFVRPLVYAIGGEDNEAFGFQVTMAIFAAVSVVMFFITFKGTRERVQPPASQQNNLGEDLRALVKNRPWLILFFVAVFTLANVAARGAATVYYFKYYVGASDAPMFLIFDQTSIVMTSGMLGLIAGVWLSKPLAARFEKRSIMIWFSLANAASMALFFVTPPDQFWLMLGLSVMGGFLAGPTVPLVWSMYADVADYGEWRWGRRSTGLVFSAALFAQKMGLAIGGAMAGWYLGLVGFKAGVEQGPAAMMGIRVLFSLFPAGLAAAAIVALVFYPLRTATLTQIERELGARRGAVE